MWTSTRARRCCSWHRSPSTPRPSRSGVRCSTARDWPSHLSAPRGPMRSLPSSTVSASRRCGSPRASSTRVVDHRPDVFGRIHQLVAGGDVLSPDHVARVARFRQRSPRERLRPDRGHHLHVLSPHAAGEPDRASRSDRSPDREHGCTSSGPMVISPRPVWPASSGSAVTALRADISARPSSPKSDSYRTCSARIRVRACTEPGIGVRRKATARSTSSAASTVR